MLLLIKFPVSELISKISFLHYIHQSQAHLSDHWKKKCANISFLLLMSALAPKAAYKSGIKHISHSSAIDFVLFVEGIIIIIENLPVAHLITYCSIHPCMFADCADRHEVSQKTELEPHLSILPLSVFLDLSTAAALEHLAQSWRVSGRSQSIAHPLIKS